MSKFLYFAYGSNVLASRLRKRCPSAIPVNVAIAKNWCLEYAKPSKDGSGKATLKMVDETSWYGRLFEIDRREIAKLDAAEGKGYGYERMDEFQVLIPETGEHQSATTYLATDPRGDLTPYDWYVALVIAGYIEAGLPSPQIDAPELHAFSVDPKNNRKGRLEAIDALKASGLYSIDDILARLQNS